jgi:hypothetical protein
MRQGNDPVFARIGDALSTRFDATIRAPLPQRWVDLINHLNEKERAERHKTELRGKQLAAQPNPISAARRYKRRTIARSLSR